MTTFFHVPRSVGRHDLELMVQKLRQTIGNDFVLLDEAVKVTFSPPASVVPNAVCTYCATANLSSSVWCVACGAPMVKQ